MLVSELIAELQGINDLFEEDLEVYIKSSVEGFPIENLKIGKMKNDIVVIINV